MSTKSKVTAAVCSGLLVLGGLGAMAALMGNKNSKDHKTVLNRQSEPAHAETPKPLELIAVAEGPENPGVAPGISAPFATARSSRPKLRSIPVAPVPPPPNGNHTYPRQQPPAFPSLITQSGPPTGLPYSPDVLGAPGGQAPEDAPSDGDVTDASDDPAGDADPGSDENPGADTDPGTEPIN